MLILVQISSNSSSLASTPLFLRGVATTSISPDSTSVLSNLTNTSNRKIPTSKSPNSGTSRLGVIKQSIRDNKFSQNQEEPLLRKSMTQNGLYIQIGVIERRLIRSRPLLLL